MSGKIPILTGMIMKSKALQSSGARCAMRLTGGKSLVTLAAHLLALFTTVMTGTLAGGYFLAYNITNGQVSIHGMLSGDFLLPLVAVATAVTIALGGLIMFIDTRLQSRVKTETKAVQTATEADLNDRIRQLLDESDHSHRILILNRSAERLNDVEADLIRKISDDFEVDQTTYHLLTEMQICTNRLMKQIADINANSRELTDPIDHQHSAETVI